MLSRLFCCKIKAHIVKRVGAKTGSLAAGLAGRFGPLLDGDVQVGENLPIFVVEKSAGTRGESRVVDLSQLYLVALVFGLHLDIRLVFCPRQVQELDLHDHPPFMKGSPRVCL